MASRFAFACVAVLFALVLAAECAQITNLPGWNPSKPYNMYSGYFDIGQGKRYFYWYVSMCKTLCSIVFTGSVSKIGRLEAYAALLLQNIEHPHC